MIRGLAVGLSCLLGSTAVSAASLDSLADPAKLLVKISEAARMASYQGVIFYQSRGRQETLRVVHTYGDDGEVERVQTLNGAPMEIIKQGGRVTCLLPRDQNVMLEQPTPQGLFPSLSAERVAQMSEYYAFRAIGEDRVAGRPCNGLLISPRDRFRYGYEVWSDAETHVPLKVNLLGQNGAVLEQVFFTQVEFPDEIPDSAFEVNVDPAKYHMITKVKRELTPRQDAALNAYVRNVPPGYRVTMRDVRPAADGQGWVEHLVLSDGLSAISVFRSKRVVSAPVFEGQSQIGAVHAFGRMVGRVHVTVVGEAPSETVRMIGENVDDTDADDLDGAPDAEGSVKTGPSQ